jgi:hypothetical protein
MKFKTVFFAIVAAIALIPHPALANGDDPDMRGREGVPPNSVGSGTRVTQEEIDYWRLINGGKTIAPKPQ